MSTRSYIAMQTRNGYHAIYCRFDGYPEGNNDPHGVGYKLNHYYNTPQKVEKLMGLGDINSLQDSIEDTSVQSYRASGDCYCKVRWFTTKEELIKTARAASASFLYIFNYNTFNKSPSPPSPTSKTIKWEDNYWVPKHSWEVIYLR
jgi:hypothetical protein